MNRLLNSSSTFLLLFVLLFMAACHQPSSQQSTDATSATEEDSIPAGAQALLNAYPTQIKGFENGDLIMADGTKILYDDGKEKDYLTRLDNADPEDMFYLPYDRSSWEPGYLQDPGRVRCEALFKKMYGDSEEAVRKHLVEVDWFGQKVLFTTVNDAAEHLKAVAKEIAQHPELLSYVKSSGSFLWRNVRFAKRRSAHSYGMTIDIAVAKSDYWAWKSKTPNDELSKDVPYCNKFPKALVQIFERHGFIWGGRWYHYDTMHFEYRPEMLMDNQKK